MKHKTLLKEIFQYFQLHFCDNFYFIKIFGMPNFCSFWNETPQNAAIQLSSKMI